MVCPRSFTTARATFSKKPFPKYAKEELKNEQLRANLRFVTHAIRNKRAKVTSELPDWQELRNTGESVKNYVLANLPRAARAVRA